MTYRDPERLDLPNLSALHRYSMCDISYQLPLLAPPSKDTKYSASGTRCHKAMPRKNKRVPGLTPDEMDTVDRAAAREDALIKELGFSGVPCKVIREKRLFYEVSGEKVLTGKPDVIYLFEDEFRTAVILDYKLGFLSVPQSAFNLQLRGAALLAWQHYGSQRCYVSIIQPRSSQWYTPALYELDDLELARGEIKELLNRIHSPDAKANPSAEACRWCPAKLICKVAYEPTKAIVTRSLGSELIVSMTDGELSRFGEQALQAEIIIRNALDELKARVVERPQDFPEWYMQSTGYTPIIEDPQDAYMEFRDLLSNNEFANTCKPSITALTVMVKKKTKMSKDMARAEVERRLGDLLIKKPKQPSLKRKDSWEVEAVVTKGN